MGTEVKVWELPKCNFCNEKAQYDFATRIGPWAFACERHYLQWRAYSGLGTGKGQRLVLVERSN
jgi:hypothetical protein